MQVTVDANNNHNFLLLGRLFIENMHYFLLALFYFSYETTILDIGSKTLSSTIAQLLDKKVTNIVLNANSSLTLEGKCGLNVFCVLNFRLKDFSASPEPRE